MAEIVEYRLENSTKELDFLLKCGTIAKNDLNQIISQRREFEYKINRRKRDKLDLLKYIKFEIKFLNFLEGHRKTLATNRDKQKTKFDDPIDYKIYLVKLSQLIRSRAAHISKLFRKLVYANQFDTELWLAYIDFALSKRWNTRVSALYWRLLRVKSDDIDIWLAAAEHEIDKNKAYDAARALYLKGLRHHPNDWRLWDNYFKMEVKYMDTVERRARILSKVVSANDKAEAEWDENPDLFDADKNDQSQEIEDVDSAMDEDASDKESEAKTKLTKVIGDQDKILSGEIPILVFDQAMTSLKANYASKFATSALETVKNQANESIGFQTLIKHIEDSNNKRRN